MKYLGREGGASGFRGFYGKRKRRMPFGNPYMMMKCTMAMVKARGGPVYTG